MVEYSDDAIIENAPGMAAWKNRRLMGAVSNRWESASEMSGSAWVWDATEVADSVATLGLAWGSESFVFPGGASALVGTSSEKAELLLIGF